MSYEFTASVKDPFDDDIHGMDFTDWLEAGETIVGTPLVEVAPAGLAISEPAVADGVVSFRLNGGTLAKSYLVSVKVTTSKPRKVKRSIRYRVGLR